MATGAYGTFGLPFPHIPRGACGTNCILSHRNGFIKPSFREYVHFVFFIENQFATLFSPKVPSTVMSESEDECA